MERSNRSGLSKSLLLKGLQCPKALWLAKNPPAFEFPPQPEREARYRAGTEVGLLAQQLFPGGVEVPFAGLSVAEQVTRTRELIAGGAAVIYEASFVFDGIFVKVDILVRDGAAWEIFEVKMATAVKEVNLDDVAIQYYVLTRSGLAVSRSFLVHIDNSYLRRGALEVQQPLRRRGGQRRRPGAPGEAPGGGRRAARDPARRRARHRHRPLVPRPLRLRFHPLLLAAHPRELDLRPARQRREEVRPLPARHRPL